MKKTILVTGATDGIGLATVKSLVQLGHSVLIHGRSSSKLATAKKQLLALDGQAHIETYIADLSVLKEVEALGAEVSKNHQRLDVLINNAGVYNVPQSVSADGLDVRFVVNTIAPYLLTRQLLPLLGSKSRVINLSSAAQSPVNPAELAEPSNLSDTTIYARSKLALTMWSRRLAQCLGDDGPAIIAVNPASMLGSKMVKQAYGVTGGNLQIGADVLVNSAISADFAKASGLYYDNDIGQFTAPHPDAMDADKITGMVAAIDGVLAL